MDLHTIRLGDQRYTQERYKNTSWGGQKFVQRVVLKKKKTSFPREVGVSAGHTVWDSRSLFCTTNGQKAKDLGDRTNIPRINSFLFVFLFTSRFATSFNGWGYFFVEVEDHELGEVYSHFFFQSSFATTSTTIVSGVWSAFNPTSSNIKKLSVLQTWTTIPRRFPSSHAAKFCKFYFSSPCVAINVPVWTVDDHDDHDAFNEEQLKPQLQRVPEPIELDEENMMLIAFCVVLTVVFPGLHVIGTSAAWSHSVVATVAVQVHFVLRSVNDCRNFILNDGSNAQKTGAVFFRIYRFWGKAKFLFFARESEAFVASWQKHCCTEKRQGLRQPGALKMWQTAMLWNLPQRLRKSETWVSERIAINL